MSALDQRGALDRRRARRPRPARSATARAARAQRSLAPACARRARPRGHRLRRRLAGTSTRRLPRLRECVPQRRGRGRELCSASTSRLLARPRPVLDVGSGRGELLDLLAAAGEHGARASTATRAWSLSAGRKDMTSRSATRSPTSDRLHAGEPRRHLLRATRRASRICRTSRRSSSSLRGCSVPEGMLVAETVNPEPVQSFKAFWIDPTHKTLLYPDVLADALPARRLRPGPRAVSGRDGRCRARIGGPSRAYAVLVERAT